MNVAMNQNYGNNNNVNNQNNNFKLMIAGRIGNKDIAREDLNTFLSSVKDFEWTDNNLYKQAKMVEIKPTFVINPIDNNNNNNDNCFQSNIASIDQYLLEENNHIRDFQQYKSDCDTRRVQFQDKICQKKKEFVDTFFSYDEKVTETSEKKEIVDAIKSNKVKIIENSFLKEKLDKYIGYLKSQESAVINYQFDFNSKIK